LSAGSPSRPQAVPVLLLEVLPGTLRSVAAASGPA